MGLTDASFAIPSLSELLEYTPAQLLGVDIAVMNLACAVGLRGAEGITPSRCLAKIDAWADAVRRYDAEHAGDFDRRPAHYHHHRGFAKFLSMATLLKHPRGLDLRYQPTAIGNYDFSDSRDDFLHGIVNCGFGTCVSFPVLFVAIGRRLGWPLYLALAKQHVFCQWVNPDDTRANFEGTCLGGAEMYPDERFHRKPCPLTTVELASGNFLRPLTRSEELALFLETRGHCLVDNRRFTEARQAYAHARRFAPMSPEYDGHIRSLELREQMASSMALVRRNNTMQPFQFEPITYHGPIEFLFPEITQCSGVRLTPPGR
jgi:hypothetical protein